MNPMTPRGRTAVRLSVAFLAAVIIFGAFSPNSKNPRPRGENLAPPSFFSPMGTDRLGRNLAPRVAEGLAGTALVMSGSLLLAVPLALAFGLPSGFLFGRFRTTPRNLLLTAALAVMIAMAFLPPVTGAAAGAARFLGPAWPVGHLALFLRAFLVASAIAAWGMMTCLLADIDEEPAPPGSRGFDFLTAGLDVFQGAWTTIPCYVLAMVLLGFMGTSPVAAILALGLTAWPYPAGVLSAAVRGCRDSDFITAARACGADRWAIVFGHLAGGVSWASGHSLAAMAAYAAAGEATLGFLGVGAGSGIVTLGTMAAEFKDYPESWWLALFPCAVTAWLVMTLSELGRQRKTQF